MKSVEAAEDALDTVLALTATTGTDRGGAWATRRWQVNEPWITRSIAVQLTAEVKTRHLRHEALGYHRIAFLLIPGPDTEPITINCPVSTLQMIKAEI